MQNADRSASADRKSRALIIVPAFDEEKALPGVLKELAAQAPDCDVVVIDDGSSDRTAAIARAAGVPVVQLSFNLGSGAAIRAGLRYAAQRGYERAIQVDGDGQHDAAGIPAIMRALDAGADLVIGSRFADAARSYEAGHLRRGAMHVLRVGSRVLIGRRFSDTTSGFRGFSQDMIAFLAPIYPVEYLDTVEVLLLAHYEGFRVAEVPTPMRQRLGGKPSNRGLKLPYHYIRLFIVMAATARRSDRAKRGTST